MMLATRKTNPEYVSSFSFFGASTDFRFTARFASPGSPVAPRSLSTKRAGGMAGGRFAL